MQTYLDAHLTSVNKPPVMAFPSHACFVRSVWIATAVTLDRLLMYPNHPSCKRRFVLRSRYSAIGCGAVSRGMGVLAIPIFVSSRATIKDLRPCRKKPIHWRPTYPLICMHIREYAKTDALFIGCPGGGSGSDNGVVEGPKP